MTANGYNVITTNTAYVHPSYNGDDINIDTAPLTGATVISDLDFNVTTDTQGHVTDANGTVATRNITLSDLGYTGATNANYYAHPTTYAGDDFSVDTGALSGAVVVSDIDINVSTDTYGHVTDANGTVSTRTLTAANLGAPTTTGGGASGSWGISVTGSSASCTGNAATATTATGLQATVPCQIVSNGATLDFGSLNATWCHFNTTATSGFYFYDSIYSLGNVTAYSDRRVKDNIEVIPDALDKVSRINGYTFTRKDRDGERQTGLIAQELLEVLPEAVVENPENGHYSIAYGNVVGLLTEAIKELKAEVEELKKPWWRKLFGK